VTAVLCFGLNSTGYWMPWQCCDLGLSLFCVRCSIAMCFDFLLLRRAFKTCENYSVSSFVCVIICVFISRMLYQLSEHKY
jgi:hypothetical protein